MENQTPESVPTNSPAASTPVTPTGTAYVPPTPPPTSGPNTPPSITPANPSPKKRSWMVMIILFVLLLIFGGGAYVYFMNMQQSKPVVQEKVMTNPSPTTISIPTAFPTTVASISAISQDKKMYTNQTFGYSVQYPSSLVASDETQYKNQAPYSESFEVKQTEQGAPTLPQLYISVLPDGFMNERYEVYNFLPKEDITMFYNINIGESKTTQKGKEVYPEFWTFKKLPSIQVAGETAVVVENDKVWESSPDTHDRRVFVKKNGKTYMLGIYYTTSEELNTFQTFLSTFKFIK